MTINYWYEFSKITDITPIRKYKIINYFKTPYDFFNSTDKQILKSRLLYKKQLTNIRKTVFNNGINEYLINNNIKMITIYDKLYPDLLKEIYDPPVVLYCRGNIELLKKRKIAIVGSRKHSTYGAYMCQKISTLLSNEEYVVVSGMAKGIDGIAHKNVVFHNTIAVLGFGFNYCYPTEHQFLKKQLEKTV